MKRFSILNLGCKVNRVESDSFERTLEGGSMISSPLDEADIIIVNTCTVTAEADKKTRKSVRSALRANEHAKVIVTGCASSIAPDVFEGFSDRVEVVPKARMSEYLEELALEQREDELALPTEDALILPSHAACPAQSRSRIGVKIQDGCNNACTYCIVCKARGASVSSPASSVITDVRRLKGSGTPEIMLTGIDLGAYDDEGLRLSGLLRMLLDETHEEGSIRTRFRISSIEPGNVTDDLLDVIASSNGRICKHLHIPLQSGSDRILEMMDRHYSSSDFIALIDKVRAKLEDASITTDIIVGFPGETEDDFCETIDIARRCGFSKIHVFPYSRREGTIAAAMPDQIDASVKSERARRLRDLASELRRRDATSRVGSKELFCIQEDGRMMSESYHEFPSSSDSACNTLIELPFPSITDDEERH